MVVCFPLLLTMSCLNFKAINKINWRKKNPRDISPLICICILTCFYWYPGPAKAQNAIAICFDLLISFKVYGSTFPNWQLKPKQQIYCFDFTCLIRCEMLCRKWIAHLRVGPKLINQGFWPQVVKRAADIFCVLKWLLRVVEKSTSSCTSIEFALWWYTKAMCGKGLS